MGRDRVSESRRDREGARRGSGREKENEQAKKQERTGRVPIEEEKTWRRDEEGQRGRELAKGEVGRERRGRERRGEKWRRGREGGEAGGRRGARRPAARPPPQRDNATLSDRPPPHLFDWAPPARAAARPCPAAPPAAPPPRRPGPCQPSDRPGWPRARRLPSLRAPLPLPRAGGPLRVACARGKGRRRGGQFVPPPPPPPPPPLNFSTSSRLSSLLPSPLLSRLSSGLPSFLISSRVGRGSVFTHDGPKRRVAAGWQRNAGGWRCP